MTVEMEMKIDHQIAITTRRLRELKKQEDQLRYDIEIVQKKIDRVITEGVILRAERDEIHKQIVDTDTMLDTYEELVKQTEALKEVKQ
jgi:regulator of replication initiation timing